MPNESWAIGLRYIQSGFFKGKVVVVPYYFLICFKGLLGEKLSLISVFIRLNTLSSWDKEKRRRRKKKRPRFCQDL